MADIVSYSYKTNPVVGDVLQRLTKCLVTVHSENEISGIRDKNRIILMLQAADRGKLKHLIDGGIRSFVVQNDADLECVLRYLKGTDLRINLLLRMRMKEYTTKTGRHYVFGLYSNQINELIPKLRENANIDKLGIHFHRKTQNTNEWDIKDELEEHLEEATLGCIDLLDIGGGIPVRYKNFGAASLPYILKKISEARRWANRKDITMIAEPGRFLAAPCIELRCKVTSVANGTIFVNCSVYNSTMDTIVENVKLEVKGELDHGESYLIKGSTPDSTDILRYRVYLKKVKVGDTITFLNAGAYAYHTDFCQLDPLKTVITA